MRILITGACGFVGSRLAQELKSRMSDVDLVGMDNLIRRGSETNIPLLKSLGCMFVHGDVRNSEDLAEIARCDWVIDCAANPSVLAGVEGGTAQLVAHNLGGTLNLLEKCRRDGAGILILSSSRVYSISDLSAIPLIEGATRFTLASDRPVPPGYSQRGISEAFSTSAPISLYGASKLASEVVALEYGAAFGFPVWIDRCGVIAGPGQFGKIDQGIFSFWIYQWMLRRSLSYIGFGGKGLQVRDLISPSDLANLVERQLRMPDAKAPRIVNVGGGEARSMSLRELSEFCARTIGPGPHLGSEPETRRYDVPLFVTDARRAQAAWDWEPAEPLHQTLEDIVRWSRDHQDLLVTFMA